tara:strand:- start:342 stop:491 length:150 start_codon:yes stop_codon:yes gene_type:complete
MQAMAAALEDLVAREAVVAVVVDPVAAVAGVAGTEGAKAACSNRCAAHR